MVALARRVYLVGHDFSTADSSIRLTDPWSSKTSPCLMFRFAAHCGSRARELELYGSVHKSLSGLSLRVHYFEAPDC